MNSETICPVKRALKALFCPWPSVHNVLIFLCFVFLFSLFNLSASEWASWVQALGSILAIFVAIAVSNASEIRFRKEELKRVKVFKLSILNLIRSLEISVAELHKGITDSDVSENLNLRNMLEAVEDDLRVLNGVDLMSFPEEGMLVPFMSIKPFVKEVLLSARELILNSDIDSLDYCEAVVNLDRAVNGFNKSYKEVRNAARISTE